MINNIKVSLRKKILIERKSFDPYKFNTENELIIEKVKTVVNSIYLNSNIASKKTLNLKGSKVEVLQADSGIGIYLPLKGEPDLSKLMINEWVLSLPKIENCKIKFVYYKLGDKLEKTNLGIWQPVTDFILEPNIVIVPALAYSIKGYRLGFGEGYYDRYFASKLSSNKNTPVMIGVCFDQFLFEKIPTEKHDVKFDYIITEKNILKL